MPGRAAGAPVTSGPRKPAAKTAGYERSTGSQVTSEIAIAQPWRRSRECDPGEANHGEHDQMIGETSWLGTPVTITGMSRLWSFMAGVRRIGGDRLTAGRFVVFAVGVGILVGVCVVSWTSPGWVLFMATSG